MHTRAKDTWELRSLFQASLGYIRSPCKKKRGKGREGKRERSSKGGTWEVPLKTAATASQATVARSQNTVALNVP